MSGFCKDDKGVADEISTDELNHLPSQHDVSQVKFKQAQANQMV